MLDERDESCADNRPSTVREDGAPWDKTTGPERVITVRLPAASHQLLKDEAAAAKVSLNQLCIARLTQPWMVSYPASLPPDDEILVLIHCPGSSEPVWIGYHSDEAAQWFSADGMPIGVSHWAPMPDESVFLPLEGSPK